MLTALESTNVEIVQTENRGHYTNVSVLKENWSIALYTHSPDDKSELLENVQIAIADHQAALWVGTMQDFKAIQCIATNALNAMLLSRNMLYNEEGFTDEIKELETLLSHFK